MWFQPPVRRLLRSRYLKDIGYQENWQVIIDGSIFAQRGELRREELHRIHYKGTERSARKNYYYVYGGETLAAPKFLSSVSNGIVDNEDGKEMKSRDCERKRAGVLMEKLKKSIFQGCICLCGDSLYAVKVF